MEITSVTKKRIKEMIHNKEEVYFMYQQKDFFTIQISNCEEEICVQGGFSKIKFTNKKMDDIHDEQYGNEENCEAFIRSDKNAFENIVDFLNKIYEKEKSN